MTIDIDTIIITQATESVDALASQGWTGDGSAYDLGAFPGDEDALRKRVGRALTSDERASLEYQIRRILTERFEAASDDQIVALRREAATAGDMSQVMIFDLARDGDAMCAAVIFDLAAQG